MAGDGGEAVTLGASTWRACIAAILLAGCASAGTGSSATAGGASTLRAQSAQGAQFDTPPPSGTPVPGPIRLEMATLRSTASYDAEAEADFNPAEPAAPSRSAMARGDGGGGWDMLAADPDPVFAEAPSPPKHKQLEAGKAGPAANTSEAAPQVASDGRAGPLLIYEAQLWMAVYEVESKQAEVIAVTRELGGFLSQQTTKHLVVRVPADRFQEALERIEKVGDVVERNIEAQDVTDQFRDLTLRLKNAEQVRERLAALLHKAQDVKQSLAIEHELDRITERIEMLKGQLKALSDRIAFSTITVEFGVRPQPSIDPEFNLPFRWLQRLGLDNLLVL